MLWVFLLSAFQVSSAKSEVHWVLGESGLSCTDVCKGANSACVEDAWPTTKVAFEKIANSVGYKCPTSIHTQLKFMDARNKFVNAPEYEQSIDPFTFCDNGPQCSSLGPYKVEVSKIGSLQAGPSITLSEQCFFNDQSHHPTCNAHLAEEEKSRSSVRERKVFYDTITSTARFCPCQAWSCTNGTSGSQCASCSPGWNGQCMRCNDGYHLVGAMCMPRATCDLMATPCSEARPVNIGRIVQCPSDADSCKQGICCQPFDVVELAKLKLQVGQLEIQAKEKETNIKQLEEETNNKQLEVETNIKQLEKQAAWIKQLEKQAAWLKVVMSIALALLVLSIAVHVYMWRMHSSGQPASSREIGLAAM